MNSYVFGIIVGVAVGIIILAVIRAKKGGTCREYDERQNIGRGKAFQAGFFTQLLAGLAVAVIRFSYGLPGSVFLWDVGVLFLGILVYALTAIHYDAYVGLNDRPERYIRMGILFVIAMGLCAFSNLHSGHEGGFEMGVLNILLAVMWVMVAVALWIHRKQNQQEEEE